MGAYFSRRTVVANRNEFEGRIGSTDPHLRRLRKRLAVIKGVLREITDVRELALQDTCRFDPALSAGKIS